MSPMSPSLLLPSVVLLCLSLLMRSPMATGHVAANSTQVSLRVKRQFPALPNGAQCFRNLDCASGCCLCSCCFIGVCVLQAEPGQICGLLSINPWGPPGFFLTGYGNGRR